MTYDLYYSKKNLSGKENKMIALFTIWPYGKEKSMSKDIAEVIKLIEKSGLSYEFHSMGTNIEGDWDRVIDLIKKCREKLLETNSRIGISILIDEKKEATNQIAHKIKSVKEKL